MAGGPTQSPGFNITGVALAPAYLELVPDSAVPEVTQRVIDAASSVPDVGRVSLAAHIPLMGGSMGFRATVDAGEPRTLFGNVVSAGYFATLEIPLRAGRDFDRRDTGGAPPVAIVSETFARSIWRTTNAVGRSLVIGDRQVEVVGVVADVRYRALNEPYLPLVFLPIGQWPQEDFFVHAKVRGGGATLAALDAAVRGADRRIVSDAAVPLRSWLDQALAPERAAQWIGGLVGVMQLALAVMALWGLVTYAVERRTAEMGVRLALGATPSSLVRLIMRPAGVAIAIGVVLGTGLGAAGAQVMQSMSVGLPPLDLVTVFPVAVAFTVVALAAAWWPARLAGLADPAASLRRE
jgi:hypothetical protein